MIFCNSKCKIHHYKRHIEVEKRHKKDPNINVITHSPKIIKDEIWRKDGTLIPRKYKIPEKIEMVIHRSKSKHEVEQIPLSKKKWTKKHV